MNKKKAFFIVNHDIVIYNFRKELVIELLKRNYDVYILSPKGNRIDKLVYLGANFIETKISRHSINPIKDFNLYRTYLKLMKLHKPDIVLTYTIKPNIYGGMAAKKLNIPYIANITGLGSALSKKGLLQAVIISMYKKAFKKINVIYTQNEHIFDFFTKHNIQPDKLVKIPGSGVNLEEFKLIPFPQSTKIEFAFISRIMKQKGIEDYLALAKYNFNNKNNYIFHVVGFIDGDYENIIKEYSNQGIIKYHGLLDDIRVILDKVHCVIHPSFYPEGISNVLLESSASGRPVITTDVPGCKEVVNDKETGYIFKANNFEDLLHTFNVFNKKSLEEMKVMGIKGRKKIENEFNRELVTNSYIYEINNIKY